MPFIPYQESLQRLRNQVAAGKPIIGAGAGTGISAKFAERGGVDLIIIYNSGRYRMAGRGSAAGLMAYGDANAIVMDMAGEVLPVVKDTPVLAGVCGTDPFRLMPVFLKQLKEAGFDGVQNFPTVGVIDGNFRQILEETGMSFNLEIEMIRLAHELDMLTCPYAFDEAQATALTEAGADIVVAHMNTTVKGSIGVNPDTAPTLAESAKRVQGHSRCCEGRQSRCARAMPRRPHRRTGRCTVHLRPHGRHRRVPSAHPAWNGSPLEPAIEAQARRFKELGI